EARGRVPVSVGQAAPLRPVGAIDLPEHAGDSGFDHAAVHGARGLLYVAHTANDAVDVVDLRTQSYVRSISGLKAVAGARVDEGNDLVFTSNRGAATVTWFPPDHEDEATTIGVGSKPNGLAYDPAGGILLSANVGVSAEGSHTVSMVDVRSRARVAE